MKKLDIYTLGQYGVNRVRSPIHVNDGELLNAQNATVTLKRGQLAISKRDGMNLINSDFANGIILNIFNIPKKGLASRAICTYSPDVPDDSLWAKAAYSPELDLFVVVGFSPGGVMTSSDGIEWTLRTPASLANWQGVTWSPELALFVAVGGANLTAADQVMTSPDGITWTKRTAASDKAWRVVGWSPDLTQFIAGNDNDPLNTGHMMRSSDGITWTLITAPNPPTLTGLIWVPAPISKWIGISQTSSLHSSSTGLTWTTTTTGTNVGLYGVAYSPELEIIVAVGRRDIPFTASTVYYSTNGTTWTAGNIADRAHLWDVVWSPEFELFFAMYRDKPAYALSDDGINWITVTLNCGGVSNSVLSYSPALAEFLVLGENEDGDTTVEMVGDN